MKNKNRGLFEFFGINLIKYFHLNLHLRRFNYVFLSLFRPLKNFINKYARTNNFQSYKFLTLYL
jgi:hypothetical protein